MVTPTLATQTAAVKSAVEKKGVFAYGSLLVFSFLYFGRPEDVIPGLGSIPLEKITGGLALLALVFGLGSRTANKRFPIELWLLSALVFWQFVGIPFAWWRGGALSMVLDKSSKTLIVAVLVSMLVTTLTRLRKLMYIQAAAVAVMTAVSVALYRGGRMGGVLGGVFDNPNDLAISIAMNWPLCLMFLLKTKSWWKKLLWGVGMLIMVRGLMLTYSRTGFLALGAALVFCLIEFGIRGRRFYLVVITVVLVVTTLFLSPSSYRERIASIWGGPQEYGDSQEERRELLNMSLRVTAQRPLFGLGPGNFENYTESWHVTHNTYTELSSECGIPALILFLLAIRAAFRNLKKVRKLPFYREDLEVRLMAGSLWASLVGYLVGAFFTSTAYQLFPYFLVAYTTALLNIGSTMPQGQTLQEKIPLPTFRTNPQLVGARNH